MGKSIQKKIKFSKGQISPSLIERTDLETYNSSAQKIRNCVSTIYGGLRTRNGTKLVSNSFGSMTGEIQKITIEDSIENYEGYNDLTSGKGWKTIPLNRERDILTFSVPENTYGAKLNIHGISSKIDENGTIVIKTEPNDGYSSFQTENLYNGVYSIKSSAQGGNSYAAALEHPDFVPFGCYGFTGGSSSGVDADFILDGVLSCEIGSSTGHENTILKLNNVEFLNIGGGGNSVIDGILNVGSGGKVSFQQSIVKRYGERGFISDGINGTAKYIRTGTDYIEGKGLFNDLTPKYGSYGSLYLRAEENYAYTGYGISGFLECRCLFCYIPIIIKTSVDGVEYQELTRVVLSDKLSDLYLDIPANHKYVKFLVDVDEAYKIYGGVSIGNISFLSLTGVLNSSSKIVPFVYNNDQKYLLVLINEKINVFSNDVLLDSLVAEGLLSEYIPNIKYAIKDDLIVFTHQDMPTKTLKRTNDGWVWSNLSFENIPYYAFEGETKEEKTVGITPSAVEGSVKITADSSLFDESWVGQQIDGNGGRVRITEYISNTVVNGVTIIPFYTTDKIEKWTKISGYEKVWSEEKGYPGSCLFAQQRLWFGGSKKLPSNIWASRINDYFNFKNAGNYDNDAIDVSIVTNNRIYNLVENRGVHIFTAGEEWTSPEGGFTPNSISFSINTRNGSLQNITPVVIGGVILFVEKNGNSILSYVYDYNQASYVSDDLSIFTNLVKKPVAMAALSHSSREKGDFLFVVLEDGTMLVVCVSFQQKIFSVSEYETDGEIKDVCCVGEDVYMVVVRDGAYCLEKIIETKTDMTTNLYANESKIDNMSIYNNHYVYVYSDKENYGKHFVENSSIQLNKAPNENVNIGIAYDYSIESNPIAINNQTITKKKRIAKASVFCEDTNKICFCGQEKKGEDIFDFYACTSYQKDVRFKIDGEFDKINILSITLNLNYED